MPSVTTHFLKFRLIFFLSESTVFLFLGKPLAFLSFLGYNVFADGTYVHFEDLNK